MQATHTQGLYFIPCKPSVASSLGSINSALLMEQMEFFFNRMDKPFYKFMEPCEHPKYKSGQSWLEATSLQRKAFNEAFDVIGIKYKSKTAFYVEENPFKDKLYASYKDCSTNETWYFRNHKAVEVFYKSLSNQSHFFIRYIPILAKKLESTNAALILENLEFCHQKQKQAFYKFIEPCDHISYIKGNSWLEETNMQRRAFDKAFDLIGTRYLSKTSFLSEKDPFKGKLYACYHDRKEKLMWFERNDLAVDNLYNELRKMAEYTYYTPKDDIIEKVISIEAKIISPENGNYGLSSNGTLGRSCNDAFVHSTNGNYVRSFARSRDLNKHIIKPYPNTCDETSREPIIKKPAYDQMKVGKMINIFDKIVGLTPEEKISESIKRNAADSLVKNFNDSLETWEIHCLAIASSKFLMGEANNKLFMKAWLRWAIKDENIEKVRTKGEFGIGDRVPYLKNKINDVEQATKDEIASRKLANEKKMLLRFKNLSEDDQAFIKGAFNKHLETYEPEEIRVKMRNLSWLKNDLKWDLLVENHMDAKIFQWNFTSFLVKHFETNHLDEENVIVDSKDIGENRNSILMLQEEYNRVSQFNVEKFFSGTKNESLIEHETINIFNKAEEGRGEGLSTAKHKFNHAEKTVEVDYAKDDKHISEAILVKAQRVLDDADEIEIQRFKETYVDYIEENDPISNMIFHENGWENPTVDLLFKHFVVNQMASLRW